MAFSGLPGQQTTAGPVAESAARDRQEGSGRHDHDRGHRPLVTGQSQGEEGTRSWLQRRRPS
jgi:hypothetical protein